MDRMAGSSPTHPSQSGEPHSPPAPIKVTQAKKIILNDEQMRKTGNKLDWSTSVWLPG